MSDFNDAAVPAVVDSNKVNNIIKVATGASVAATFIPIPFADIPPITAAQSAMVLAIFKEYKRPVHEKFLATVIPALVVSQLGKKLATYLASQFAGPLKGPIRAAVALTFTVGLGKLTQMYCEKVDPESDFGDFIKSVNIMDVGEQFKSDFEDEQKVEK